jgi:hypothetical protein
MFVIRGTQSQVPVTAKIEQVIYHQLLNERVMINLRKFWLNEAPPGAID